MADPCLSATCGENSYCVPDLSDSSYTCECDAVYVDDGLGGCMLEPEAEWTFMMYWAMDNNLYNQSLPELEDWMNVNYNEHVRLLVLVDGWNQDGYIVEMLPGQQKVVFEYGYDPDTSDWITFADFGVWVINNYPAKHYAIIPSDHGGDWRNSPVHLQPFEAVPRAICWDDNSDDPGDGIDLTNGELAAALSAMTTAAGQKLDFVIMDACVMGGWEVAEVCAPYADFLITSEESMYGWQVYTPWLNLIVDNIDTITPLEAGEAFVDLYSLGGQFGYPGNAYATTCALTDLAEIPAMTDAVSALADAFMANESVSFYGDVDQARYDAQHFHGRGYLVDVVDFARNVSDLSSAPSDVVTAADDLIAQTKITVAYDWANLGHNWVNDVHGANGLYIYMPTPWYADPHPLYDDYGAVWSQHSTWDEFLNTFTTGDGTMQCAEGSEALDYMGTTMTTGLDIDECHDNDSSPHIAQSFLAPADEIHGVRIGVYKDTADAEEHDGFTLGVRNADGEWLWGPHGLWAVEADSEIHYLCFDFKVLYVEEGEELEIVFFGGDEPFWWDEADFATPITWLIEYAADADSDPPYADGDVIYDDGDGEVLIQNYNGDGIRGTMWFEIY